MGKHAFGRISTTLRTANLKRCEIEFAQNHQVWRLSNRDVVNFIVGVRSIRLFAMNKYLGPLATFSHRPSSACTNAWSSVINDIMIYYRNGFFF